jgi:hypothetical protein
MSALDIKDPHVPDQLVDQLAKGYDALALELRRVHDVSRHLENKLAWAKQQVRYFCSCPWPMDPRACMMIPLKL